MNKKRVVNIKTIFGAFDCVLESNKPEKGYTVTVPKLRGVVTCGDTVSKAKKMVQEAIELHCECLLDEGLAEVKVYRPGKELGVRVGA